ncbi:MAG: DUF4127 family protein, partial [Phascolarctobacterium sp.]|nr:DUF4127 family protein [Phascolarctobacterium sp.]
VRMDVYRNLIWRKYWPNSGLNEEQTAVAEEDITHLMVSVAEPMLGEAVKDYRFTLPWNRMFEVYVERK